MLHPRNNEGAEMKKFMMAVVVLSAWASVALGQTPPPATPPAATPPSAKPVPKGKAAPVVHSPESIECSKQADAKGLHGPERVRFRANCKKKLMKQKS
jgi:hypothetical protein